MIAALLAHEGGWDEALLVVGPLLIIGVLLWLANRRVKTKLEDLQAEQSTHETK